MRVTKEAELLGPNAYEQLHTEAFKKGSPDFDRAVNNFYAHICDTPATLAESYLLKALLEYLYHEAPDDEQNLFMVAELLEAGILDDIKDDCGYNSLHGFIKVKDDNEMAYSDLDRLFSYLKEKDTNHISLKHYQLFYKLAGSMANEILKSCRQRLSVIGTKSNIFKYTRNINDVKELTELMLTTYNAPRTYSITDKLYDYLKKYYQIFQSGRKPVKVTELNFGLKGFDEWKTFYSGVDDDNDDGDEIVHEDDPLVLAEKVRKEVLGQDSVIDDIAVSFSQHLRSKSLSKKPNCKCSFLLVGSTGVGKTEILRLFSEICKIPFIDINTANLSPIGWRGINIGDYIRNYKNEKKLSWKDMEYSVIFYDEFDKISPYIKKDVSEGSAATNWNFDIQRDIMQLFNVGKTIPIRASGDSSEVIHNLPVDNLLICFSGAFSGIEEIIKKRKRMMGELVTTNSAENDVNYLKELKTEDLEKFGFQRELLGRIGKIKVLNPMTEDLLFRIMKETSGNAVSKNIYDCKLLYNTDVRFSDEALQIIAKLTDKKLGARGIDSIIEDILHKVKKEPQKFRNRALCIDEGYITNYLVNGK